MVPPLKLLRNVVDRMKNIHDYLGITANMGGELTLKVETDMVSIATFYTQLHHPQIGERQCTTLCCSLTKHGCVEGRSPPRHDLEKAAEVKVDIKKFAKFLYSYQVSPTNVILCKSPVQLAHPLHPN